MNLLERITVDHPQANTRLSKVVVCTHATRSTVELCKALKSLGCTVSFFPVAYSTQKNSLKQLASIDITLLETEQDVVEVLVEASCIIEDGARLSKLINKYKLELKDGFYSVEQTSGGARYHRENPPSYPVINVARSALKLDIENRRATPESVIQQYSQVTGHIVNGKKVLVIGFGAIGEGLARILRILGASVTVCDTSKIRLMSAKHRGYSIVMQQDINHVIPSQDIIFMATNRYDGDVISYEQLLLMKDGSCLCNAGSGTGEIASSILREQNLRYHDADIYVKDEKDRFAVEIHKADRKKAIDILAYGYPINLNLGEGTSHDAIEIVMGLLLIALITGPVQDRSGLQPLSTEHEEYLAGLCIDTASLVDRSPRYVKSSEISLQARPYGGIFPFHNDINTWSNFAVVRAWFKKGEKTRGHFHLRSQEAYFIESGQCEIITWHYTETKRSTHIMGGGDYLLIPEGYFHDVIVTSKEDLRALVISSPPFEVWDQFFNESEVA